MLFFLGLSIELARGLLLEAVLVAVENLRALTVELLLLHDDIVKVTGRIESRLYAVEPLLFPECIRLLLSEITIILNDLPFAVSKQEV